MRRLISILTILLIVLICSGAYFYIKGRKVVYQANQEANSLSADNAASGDTILLEETIAELSKFIDLPKEMPILAIVSDPKALAAEPFFARAEVGDRVLIYKESRKAILYRPSTKKVIEMESIPGDQTIDPGN